MVINHIQLPNLPVSLLMRKGLIFIKETLFIAFLAFIGEFILGWCIRYITGSFLWVYPGSVLVTTSLYAFPLWYLGAIVIKIIMRVITRKAVRGPS